MLEINRKICFRRKQKKNYRNAIYIMRNAQNGYAEI